MGGILSGASNAKQQKAVGALQFQTSQHGGVVPLVYGTTRVTPNLIDYDDFKAAPAHQGSAGKGGGGGKGGGQQYRYSASVIMGLCQGPIVGIATVWWDKNVGTLSSLPAGVYLGSDGQAADPYWETNHSNKALGYSGTATVVANNFAMGNTATLPNFSLGEDDFIVQESGVGGVSGVTPGGPALRSGSGPITGGFSDDPVRIVRSTPADASNSIQLECLDRSNNYNTVIVEAFDQAAIERYSVRRDSSLKARAIVDPVTVAPIVAQLLLQRALLFRNTYHFKLGWK